VDDGHLVRHVGTPLPRLLRVPRRNVVHTSTRPLTPLYPLEAISQQNALNPCVGTVVGALAKPSCQEHLGTPIHLLLCHVPLELPLGLPLDACRSNEGQTLAGEAWRGMARHGQRCLQHKTLVMILCMILCIGKLFDDLLRVETICSNKTAR
jgi:hypothetical protein